MKNYDKLKITEKSILAQIRNYLSILAIILTGPVVIRLPDSTSYLQEFASRFGIFIFLIALWELLLWFISNYILDTSVNQKKIKKILLLVVAFCLSSSVLFSAGHLEDKITHEFLAVLLISIGLRAVSVGLKRVDYKYLSFIFLMIYFFGISNFSGALTAAGWHWPFLVVALALQAGLHAAFYLEQMKSTVVSDGADIPTISLAALSRLHAIALLFAPVSVCFLHYLGYFPKSYLICLAALYFMLSAAELSRKLERKQFDKSSDALACLKKIENLSVYSTIVFLSCFIAAAFFEL